MVAEIKSEDKDMVSKIIQYEAGNMNEEETIEFFQELIDTGMAYTLQGVIIKEEILVSGNVTTIVTTEDPSCS